MNTLQDYWSTLERIRAKVRHTPLLPAAPLCLNDTGAEVWFKPECFQVTGSFKARGCYNRMLSLPEETKQRGVATASGGNFGAAAAYAARDLSIDAAIYVMNTSTELARAFAPMGSSHGSSGISGIGVGKPRSSMPPGAAPRCCILMPIRT